MIKAREILSRNGVMHNSKNIRINVYGIANVAYVDSALARITDKIAQKAQYLKPID